jgi:protein tyrosine/serine phosphatase
MTDAAADQATPGRWIPFEAGFNFRDLGGYPARDGTTVRWGRLYRADTLHRLSASDLSALRDLGLRTVVDLRAASEIDDFGRLDLDACPAPAWHHVPMLDVVVLRPNEAEEIDEPPAPTERSDPGAHYVELLGSGEAAVRVISLLAREGGLPAVFHCTAGRDRTGMVAAMVLELLGVPDDVIGHDYELTNEARSRSDAWIAQNEPEFAAYLARFSPDQRVTRGETILGFLAGLRARYGSVEQLLVDRGLRPVDLDRLRGSLLD